MHQTQPLVKRENWQLNSRSIYIHVPLFKMKLYKPENSSNPFLFFHLPAVKKVVAYTSDLKTLLKTYKFSHDPHAFQISYLSEKDNSSRPYIVAGSTLGTIMCQPLTPNPQSQQESPLPDQLFTLNTMDKDKQEIFINDILSLGNNKIANCFNNGTIAFWDLKQKRRLLSLPNVHDSYTYKLRRIDERLISCGHDGMTVVTDLIKMRPISFLKNADSCWCSTPLNYDIVASVGLFNRVNIWDLRAKMLIQSAQLNNGESSFVTVFDQNHLVLGDGPILKKCDLRTMRCNTFASENMLASAQNIIVTQNGGYACGRRFELCHFTSVEAPNPTLSSVNKIYNPFTEGDMFMYETVFNRNLNGEEDVQNQEDNNNEDDQQQQEQEEIMQDQMLVVPNQQDFAELGEEEQQYHEFIEENDMEEELIMQENESTPIEVESSSQIQLQKSSQQQTPLSHLHSKSESNQDNSQA